jgi:hypothetical protein
VCSAAATTQASSVAAVRARYGRRGGESAPSDPVSMQSIRSMQAAEEINLFVGAGGPVAAASAPRPARRTVGSYGNYSMGSHFSLG